MATKLSAWLFIAIVLSSPGSADDVVVDGKPFVCDEGDKVCSDAIAEIKKNHWKKHVIQSQLAIEAERLKLRAEEAETTAKYRDTRAALLKAATDKEAEEDVERRQKLKKRFDNLPGLKLTSAKLVTGSNNTTVCENVLPYVMWACAVRADCTDSDTQKCPSKRDCELPIDVPKMCSFDGFAQQPVELKIEYTCDGGDPTTLTFSTRSTVAHLVCDLR